MFYLILCFYLNFNFFKNNFSDSFSSSSSTSNCLSLVHLIYFHQNKFINLLCTNHLNLFFTFFFTIYFIQHSNIFIFNLISYSLNYTSSSISLFQMHLLFFMMIFNNPTFCLIYHHGSYHYPRKIFLQLDGYFMSLKTPVPLPFQPINLNWMVYILFYFSIILYYRSKTLLMEVV